MELRDIVEYLVAGGAASHFEVTFNQIIRKITELTAYTHSQLLSLLIGFGITYSVRRCLPFLLDVNLFFSPFIFFCILFLFHYPQYPFIL